METVKYVLMLYRDMAIKRKLIFVLILLSETAAVLCLFFSYGLFMNTMNDVGRTEEDNYSYGYSIDENTEVYAKEGINGLMERLGDDLKRLDLRLYAKGEDGSRISIGASYYRDTPSVLDESGELPEAMISEDMEGYVYDGVIVIDGVSYKVSEKRGNVYAAYVPLSSISDKWQPYDLYIELGSTPTKRRVEEINSTVSELLGGVSYSAPEAMDLMQYQINNTFIAYAFMIVVMVVLDLSMYFRYILSLRENMIRVFSLCGATKPRIALIFMLEELSGLCVCFALAYALFRLRLIHTVESFYSGISDFFDKKAYLMILCIYLAAAVTVLIITTLPTVIKTVSAGERRERE